MTDDALTPERPLDPMALAYAYGDFARVRELAAAELQKPRGEQDLKAANSARMWRTRLAVDGSVYLVLGFATVLFCAIVLRYVGP